MVVAMSVCVCVCVSVCLSVCLFVKLHLIFGASVCPENAVTYLVCNGGQKFDGKLLCSRATVLPTLYGYHAVGIFSLGIPACASKMPC